MYKKWTMLLATLSLMMLLLGLFTSINNQAVMFQFPLVSLESCNLEALFVLDWISLFFSSTVLFISSMVMMFSEEYMEAEPNPKRFIYLILLFVLSMILLVTSPNLMSILLGWDGLGLVSYCLVIYYQNPRSYNAGMITVLSNRIGDVMILIAIAYAIKFGSWNMISMNKLLTDPLFMFLITLAAMTKSAQIPFSAWLPAAMAAPTPVSSLVHSSTLVTAGVFLLIRFNNLFENKYSSLFLFILASLTMLMAGMSANLETDMKKIIALSTLSQLGIMMMTLALNMWKLAYFHMITHAMFKALLFLCAGFFIHNTKNNQDIRKIGSLHYSAPTISSCMILATMALMGVPFTSGFYSKDLILETMMINNMTLFMAMITLISFTLTMMYSIRLSFLTLWTENASSSTTNLMESKTMTSPIKLLTLAAITTGSFMSWTMFSPPETPLLTLSMKLTGLILIILGIIISTSLWLMNSPLTKNFLKTLPLMGSMWFLPLLSRWPFSLTMSKMEMTKPLEMGWNELMGPEGTHLSLTNKSKISTNFQLNETKTLIILIPLLMLIMFM